MAASGQHKSALGEMTVGKKGFSGLDDPYMTIGAIADGLGVSRDTASRLFGRLPGVIDLGRSEDTQTKRRYRVLRVPRSVFEKYLRDHAA